MREREKGGRGWCWRCVSPCRYDEEHRLKLTYEQVIRRLKNEQLSFPGEVAGLEGTVAQKEADYEQLLMMSHDANQSKEQAKQELSKFEVCLMGGVAHDLWSLLY